MFEAVILVNVGNYDDGYDNDNDSDDDDIDHDDNDTMMMMIKTMTTMTMTVTIAEMIVEMIVMAIFLYFKAFPWQ